jgi:hypothetical protein
MVALAAQGFEEVQAAPWVQAVHTPPMPQTPLAPPEVVQNDPTALNVWSVQTGAPLLHTMVAVASQGFDEVQLAPALQGVHTPAELHTPAVPLTVHEVPIGAVVWTVQTGPLAEQTQTALVAQGSVEVQGLPQRRKSQLTRRTPDCLFVQSMV